MTAKAESRFTLSEFFNVKANSTDKVDELLATDQFEFFQKKLSEEAGGAKLPPGYMRDMVRMMMGKLDELLDIDIPKQVFAEAWSRHPSLQTYCNSEKYPPGQSYLVPMLEHPLTTVHTPSLEPQIGGKTLGRIAVRAEVKFVIKGAILEVRDAKIMKIKIAGIEGKGGIKLGELNILMREHKMQLPFVFDMGEGVPIKARKESPA